MVRIADEGDVAVAAGLEGEALGEVAGVDGGGVFLFEGGGEGAQLLNRSRRWPRQERMQILDTRALQQTTP